MSTDSSTEGDSARILKPAPAVSPKDRRRRRQIIWVALGITSLLAAIVALTLPWPSGRSTPLVSVKSGKCVSIVDGDADKARAFQFGCTGQPGSIWYLQQVAHDDIRSTSYRIVNITNGKCLSVSDELFGEAYVVVQRSCENGSEKDQTWIFDIDENRGNGWIYGRFVNMQRSHCMDINGESIADGTPVIEWKCGKKLNQRFRVMKEAVG